MHPYPLDQYETYVSELPLQHEDDLLIFLARAARLASLGRTDQFKKWPTIAADLNCDVAELLQARFAEAAWELEELDGELLAFAIIEAQDMHCLIELDKIEDYAELLPRSAQGLPPRLEPASELVLTWSEKAEMAYDRLDDETALLLEDFLVAFPIMESHRLSVVKHPLGTSGRNLLARLAPESVYIDLWSRHTDQSLQGGTLQFPSEEFEKPFLMAADSGKPSDIDKQLFQSHDLEADLDGLLIRVTCSLDEDWTALIEIDADPQLIGLLNTVRIGARQFAATTPTRQTWDSCLGALPAPFRQQLLRQKIVLELTDGRCLTC